MKQTKAEKLIDQRVDKAYRASCSNIPIDIMDISKVFNLGRAQIAVGVDDNTLKTRIREFVETIRTDKKKQA